MEALSKPPVLPTLEEKQKALIEHKTLMTSNKGCTVQYCHGSYTHSGPCCVNLNCTRRNQDI